MTRSAQPHLRSIVLIDAAIVLILLIAAIVADTGGGAVRLAGLRLWARSASRPLLLGAVILAVRLVRYRRVGPFGRDWRTLGAWTGLSEDVRQAPRASLPGWREILLAGAAQTAAVALVFHAQLADFRAVPDFGDPLFSMWRMAWLPHQLAASPWHLFDANIFYPERATLTFSDSMILPSLTAIPLLVLGVPVSIAYTVLLLSSFVLTGIATYLLARAFSMGRLASWVSALIFSMYPYRIDHYSHLELQMAQWMPIAVLAVHRLMATGRVRYMLYLSLALGAQWYSSMYYGVFLTVYAGVFASVLAFAWKVHWRTCGYAVGGLLLGVAIAGPLASVYSGSEKSRGIRSLEAVQAFSAQPIDYLKPTPRSALYGSIRTGPRTPERELFPGVVPVVLTAIGAVPPLSATRVAFLAAGLVAFDGSLGFNGHWWRAAYSYVGPVKSLRAPARFALLVGLTLALVAGFGVERIRRRFASPAAGVVLAVGLTVVVLVETWPVLQLSPVWSEPPPLYAALGPESGAVLFEYPMYPNTDEIHRNLPYLYFSTWHWTRMVNGYSGFIPQSYYDLAAGTAGFPLEGSVAYLQHAGVTHVTLNCALWDTNACDITMRRLDADRRFRLIINTRWNGAPARLYELAR